MTSEAGTYWLKASGSPVGPEADGQQEALVAGVEDAAERHGVAPFGLALTGLGHQLQQLGADLGGQSSPDR